MDNGLINGVKISRLKEIKSERGSILHFFKVSDPDFIKFGECYFSEIYSKKVKGWKIHEKQTQNLTVPIGLVKFVIFDPREHSETKNKINEITIGRQVNYIILTIPPGVYYAFKNLSEKTSLVANCSDIQHDINESITINLNSDLIPYKWEDL